VGICQAYCRLESRTKIREPKIREPLPRAVAETRNSMQPFSAIRMHNF